MLYAQRREIMNNRSSGGSAEANKALMTGSKIQAGLLLTEARVKEKNKAYQYLAGGYVYDEFNSDYMKYTGIQENEGDGLTAGATSLGELLAGGSKSYKDRIMVIGNNKQLILNDVWGDDLEALPEEICELTELTQLNLTDQPNVSTIPACIGNLSNLKKLNLWNNGLNSLPPEIGNLSALESLNVSNNNLTELPVELKNCKNLKKLVVKGNNISNLDEFKTAFPKLKVK